MTKPIKLSALQVVLLLINGRLIIELIYQPSIAVPPANQDIWIAEILALVYLFVFCWPLLYLAGKFTTMTPIEYSEKILGKYAGRAFGLVFVAVLLVNSQLNLSLDIVFLEAVLLPETPPYATALFMLVPCAYLVYKGPETMGRLMEIVAPTILIVIVLFTALGLKDMKFGVFLPVLADSDFSQLAVGAWKIASRFTEIVVLAMLTPYIKEKNRTARIFTYAAVIGTFFMLLFTVSVQARLGIALAKEETFPYFAYVRHIAVYDVIERIESLNVFIWLIGLFLKFSLYLYLSLSGLARIFRLSSPRVLIIPVTAALYIIALESPLTRFVVGLDIASRFLPIIGLSGMFVIPAVLLVGYFWQRRRYLKAFKSGG